MKIDEKRIKTVKKIWDNYVANSKIVYDTKGKVIKNIDEQRFEAISEIKKIIASFQKGESNISEFKTALDSYNKRNNLWGFTATKGQMFFNLLTRNSENKIQAFEKLIKDLIIEPKNLDEALSKIDRLDKYASSFYIDGANKQKLPNPSSTGYFLSYFWQIYNPQKWPILYTSLVKSYIDLELWEEHDSQRETYKYFFELNKQIISILKKHTRKNITNWDAEHAFWYYKGNPFEESKDKPKEKPPRNEPTSVPEYKIKPTFELKDYLLPKIADLVKIGEQTKKSASAKGHEFEKRMAEIFDYLDFKVEALGQGKGRNPDAILKYRKENVAFIVDAKAYSEGYSLGIDDRAIKEYINFNCPKLIKDGYKKIGFIIVSNSFKSNFDTFINDITWNTDIKRFILLTSEALLYLFAYKMKSKLSLDIIIEKLISCGNLVTAEDIIREFEDV